MRKSGVEILRRSHKLFCFECSYFLQIRKAIRVAPEVDMFALHVVGLQIQPEILI